MICNTVVPVIKEMHFYFIHLTYDNNLFITGVGLYQNDMSLIKYLGSNVSQSIIQNL